MTSVSAPPVVILSLAKNLALSFVILVLGFAAGARMGVPLTGNSLRLGDFAPLR